MRLYYHKTDGGAEYYSTTYVECPNGDLEGTFDGVVMRTDGNTIEIYSDRISEQNIKLVINGCSYERKEN